MVISTEAKRRFASEHLKWVDFREFVWKTRFSLILRIHCTITVHTPIYAPTCILSDHRMIMQILRVQYLKGMRVIHTVYGRASKCSGFLKIYICNKIYYNFVRGGKNKQMRTYRIKPTCVSIIQSLKWRQRGWMQLHGTVRIRPFIYVCIYVHIHTLQDGKSTLKFAN